MRVRDHRTGALRHHLQKPRKGESYMGSVSGVPGRACASEPHTQLQALVHTQEAQLAACFSRQTQPALAQCPSASVVDMEVERLVSEQGVRVIKLEQVDALPGVVMAASLHISVAVPPVHRHDLPVAAP